MLCVGVIIAFSNLSDSANSLRASSRILQHVHISAGRLSIYKEGNDHVCIYRTEKLIQKACKLLFSYPANGLKRLFRLQHGPYARANERSMMRPVYCKLCSIRCLNVRNWKLIVFAVQITSPIAKSNNIRWNGISVSSRDSTCKCSCAQKGNHFTRDASRRAPPKNGSTAASSSTSTHAQTTNHCESAIQLVRDL